VFVTTKQHLFSRHKLSSVHLNKKKYSLWKFYIILKKPICSVK
jgi:hypothetical protein